MQPYFFPYLGYFSLIKATDKFIIFDTPQYQYRSWINRNRIIDINSDAWRYITVPVKKHKLEAPIKSIQIQNSENWKDKVIAQLGYYRKFAPNYETVIEFLLGTLNNEFDNLSELNIHTLEATCNYIGIDFNYEVFSEMDIAVEPAREPDEWALNICKAMKITDYINPERGQLFVNKDKYNSDNINLRFLVYENPEYDQKKNVFIPGLSIIDALMFNSLAEINQLLDGYHLIR